MSLFLFYEQYCRCFYAVCQAYLSSGRSLIERNSQSQFTTAQPILQLGGSVKRVVWLCIHTFSALAVHVEQICYRKAIVYIYLLIVKIGKRRGLGK